MKEVEVILKTDSVRVRIMSLDPREIAEWHYHTQVTDDIFGLTGTILIRWKEPDEEIKLVPGMRCQIKPGKIHQLENVGSEGAKYLLVQGVGKYDFNTIGK